MLLRSTLRPTLAPLAVVLFALLSACSAEVADDPNGAGDTAEEALLCGDTRALNVDPSDPNDEDFSNVTFAPSKAAWWDAKNDPSLRALRVEARRAAAGALLVRESVTQNGARFRYTYRTFRPEVALPTDIRFEGLEGCRWSREDSTELARLRADARKVVNGKGAVLTFERVRPATVSERWRYDYGYDMPVATKPSGVTFVPATLDWRTDDQATLEDLRRAARADATAKRLRVTSETVTESGAAWSYAYRLGQ